MAKVNTVVEFDYTNLQYKVTALGTGSDWTSTATVMITDPYGYHMKSIDITPNDNTLLGLPRGHTSGNFTTSAGSYNYLDSNKNVFTYVDYATSLRFYNDPGITGIGIFVGASAATLSGLIKGFATGTLPGYNTLSKVDQVYSGLALLGTRGDAVPHLYIDRVTDKTQIRYNSALLSSTFLTGSTCNLDDSIGVILSGAYSGTKFHVTSHTPASSGIIIDRDATNWSGAYFKLMPYRTVTSYSGWETFQGQEYGIHAEFGLSSARSTSMGSLAQVGVHLSGSYMDIGGLLGLGTLDILTPVTVAAITSPTAAYGYDILAGDIVQYYLSGTSTLVYGTILDVANNSPAPGFTTIKYWPTGKIAPTPSGNANVFRSNYYDMLTFPQFGKTYQATVVYGSQVIDNYKITAPSADLEISANEFDSTYAAIGDTVHFHVGPVHLSNGQVIPQSYLLRYVVNMYQGDVTTATPVYTWTAHGTMGTDVGLSTNGSFFKKGIFTPTYNQALNASETLILDISANLGSAGKQKIITLPVQPSA